MSKKLKSLEELRALLDKEIRQYSIGQVPNPQWVRIVPADPEKHGANWRVAHSGPPGDFADAIERVMPGLQKLYDLAPEKSK